MTKWFEVWANEHVHPPHLLLVLPTAQGIEIREAHQEGRVVLAASTYPAARLRLIEDRYLLVQGRMRTSG